jgi:predicted MFS family arabinose efflux permease
MATQLVDKSPLEELGIKLISSDNHVNERDTMLTENSPTAASLNTPIEWSAKVIMLSGGLMTSLALGAIASVLPQIETALARGPDDSLLIKQLLGVVGLSMVIGAPLAGFLADRIPVRRVLVAACLLYSVAGTAGLYLSNLPALIATRLLLGIMAAAIATTSMTLINTRLAGADRAKWMGAHVSVAMISNIIVHPLAGYLGEFGWRWPFLLYGLALPLAVVSAGVKDRVAHRSASAAKTQGPRLLAWFPIRFAALALIIGSITYLPMVYVPFLMRQMGVASPSSIALVLMGDSILGSVLAMLYGRSQRYMSTYAAFAFSFACAGVGMLVAALAATVVGVVAGMMIFGVGLGWFVPNLMNAVAKRVALEQQGRAVGLVKAAHYLAAPLCIVAVEPLAKQIGPNGAMLAAAVLSLGLLLLVGYKMVADHHRNRAAAVAG